MNSGRSQLILFAVACALLLGHAAYYWSWIEDDTFITLRYAQNFADGQGLVFNPGQAVEGYSNFLWVMLAAAAIKLQADPLNVLRAAGLLGALLTLLMSWRLARSLWPQRTGLSIIAPLLLAISPVLPRHAVTGLETALYAGLLVLAVYWANEARRRWPLAITLFLLSLLRPEGIALALVILAWRRLSDRDHNLRAPLVFLGLFLVYYVWRWLYFAAPVANTFHFKMTGGGSALSGGLHYTLNFLRHSFGVVLVGLSLALLYFKTFTGRLRLITMLAGLQVVIVILAGGDWMHHYRFYAPLLPLLTATAAAGAGALLGAANQRRLIAGLMVVATLLVACIGVYKTEREVARVVMPAVQNGEYLWQCYRDAGLWLKENTDPDDLVAVSDIGAIGYYSKREILDMFGLVNPHIARRPGRLHYKNDPQHVLDREPDIVILVTNNSGGYWRIPDRALSQHPDFRAQYEEIHCLPMGFGDETIRIYSRLESAVQSST
jgi:arabinofuranosyltransferase